MRAGGGAEGPLDRQGAGPDANPKLGRVLAGGSRDCWVALSPSGD